MKLSVGLFWHLPCQLNAYYLRFVNFALSDCVQIQNCLSI